MNKHSDGEERLRRWRLVLGGAENDGTDFQLGTPDLGRDRALQALYDSDRGGGLGSSAPSIARWLGDIRDYFPAPVVRVMQQDALQRLDLRQMLLEPEILEMVDADVHLVADIVALNKVMPTETRETARRVVGEVVRQLQGRLQNPLIQAVKGSLNRATRRQRPRHQEIDWSRTIWANLRHYQPSHRTIIPEKLVGYGRRRQALRHIILCLDQSGSMATSVVYGSIFGAVLASLPSLRTNFLVFDTAVVDLTEVMHDPVELLFGTQLGGGTDIARALAYCQTLVQTPQETVLILISDLYEGGNQSQMLRRVAELADSGVNVIPLLALNDDGAPSFNHAIAAALAQMGLPAFACTPDLFPDLMAAAINNHNILAWKAKHLPARTWR